MSNPTSSTEAREINIAGAILMGLVVIIGIMLLYGPPEDTRAAQGSRTTCEVLVPAQGMTSMGAAASFASRYPGIPRTQVNEMFVAFAERHGLVPDQTIPPLENGALEVCLTPDKTEVDWIYVK